MPILPEHKEILLSQSNSKTLPQYTIYMHINNITNKKYIGQTKQPLNKRWKNGLGYKDQKYFYNAIKKYRWENFSHIILESEILTLEEANSKEKFWISYYDTQNPEKGYNISSGGVDKDQLQLAHEGWKNWREKNPKQFQKNLNKALQARVKTCSIAVYNVELDQVYYSAGEASRKTGADQSGITKCCKGKQKTAGGYHWKYANQQKR